jgi:predicted aldo/keto reductase-like oxidoreductase
VHTLSLGAAQPTDFDEHLKTFPLIEQADEILPSIIERLQKEAVKTLGEDWVKTWQVGLPRHEHTPGGVNIPVILWLRNLAIAYDMVEYAKMRYNLLGNAGDWFPGQKANNISQINLSECLSRSPHQEIIPKILQETDRMLGGETVKRLSQS